MSSPVLRSEVFLAEAATLLELSSALLSKEPTEETIEALVAITSPLGQLVSDETLRHLEDLVEKRDVDRFKREFAELLLSPYSGRYVPPYESSFLTTFKTGRLTPPSPSASAEVDGYYNHFGFSPARLKMDPRVKSLSSDHIALELAFLAFLLQTAKGKQRVQVARQFVRNHLNGWAMKFTDMLFEQCQTPYFMFVSCLLRDGLAAVSGLLKLPAETARQ